MSVDIHEVLCLLKQLMFFYFFPFFRTPHPCYRKCLLRHDALQRGLPVEKERWEHTSGPTAHQHRDQRHISSHQGQRKETSQDFILTLVALQLCPLCFCFFRPSVPAVMNSGQRLKENCCGLFRTKRNTCLYATIRPNMKRPSWSDTSDLLAVVLKSPQELQKNSFIFLLFFPSPHGLII